MGRRSDSNQPGSTAGADISHQWLAEQLRKLYDHVLDEPVPEEMRQLIERYGREGDKRD